MQASWARSIMSIAPSARIAPSRPGRPLHHEELAGGGSADRLGRALPRFDQLCAGHQGMRTVSGACYSKLATNMREYVYENMWAGPRITTEPMTWRYVTGFIRTDKATISLNGSWAENINDPASTFIEFIGDKGGIKLTYGGGFTFFGTKDGKLWRETPEIKGGQHVQRYVLRGAQGFCRVRQLRRTSRSMWTTT